MVIRLENVFLNGKIQFCSFSKW